MKMDEMIFCQCCGIPLQAAADFGTEADGTASADYCVYCYKDGAFTQDCTMEEMIQHCAQFYEEFKHEDGSSYTRASNDGGNNENPGCGPKFLREVFTHRTGKTAVRQESFRFRTP